MLLADKPPQRQGLWASSVDQLQSLPRALRIVAAIKLVGGILAVVGILVRLTQGHLHLDLGVLGIPMYFGLLRLSRGWRTCALVFLWIGMVVAVLALGVGTFGTMPTFVHVFGIELASVQHWWTAVGAVPLFLLCFWQYRVLLRHDVRSLFLGPTVGVTA